MPNIILKTSALICVMLLVVSCSDVKSPVEEPLSNELIGTWTAEYNSNSDEGIHYVTFYIDATEITQIIRLADDSIIIQESCNYTYDKQSCKLFLYDSSGNELEGTGTVVVNGNTMTWSSDKDDEAPLIFTKK